MNNIKSEFSIKDLENLSGIKAHTIRIWEKRYNLFEPNRTKTNIRSYSLESLQKLLNIAHLYNGGMKISKIAQLNSEEFNERLTNQPNAENNNSHYINTFKLAALNFDKILFLNTYNTLEKDYSFSDIFFNIFIPLIGDIGFLWQTNTITPAQEHFISELIKQKILINTEKHQTSTPKNTKTLYALFLPDNEIHELGLQFINYKLTAANNHTIYLGPSVPVSSLKGLEKHYKNITYISYFTVKPETDKINSYLINFYDNLLKNNDNQLWVLGKLAENINTDGLPKAISAIKSIDELVKKM
ncbi:MerR family transcriptional regulator [Lacinutrix undariae]